MANETHHEEGSGDLTSRPPEPADLAGICAKLNVAGAKYVVVGGLAMVQAGYPRFTEDIDLLIETTLVNEEIVLRVLGDLPDGVARQLKPGEVARYGVIRIADEIVVDLMRSGCGVTYYDAIGQAIWREVEGVRIPFASKLTLWKMKQTVREKDVPDRIFLREALEREGVKLDPLPTSVRDPLANAPTWLKRLLDRIFGGNP